MKATIYILLIVAYFQQVNCSVTCPTGWTSLKTGCYKFISEGTYDQVQAWCANEGGYPIEINNQEERDAYTKFQQDSGFGHSYYVWVGATDRAEEGKWNWGHSGKEVTFTDWASGQPNDGTTGNCILTMTASNAFKWRDYRCSYTGGKGLCEHDGTRTTTPEISTTTPTASPPTCPTTACPEPITFPEPINCPEAITCPTTPTLTTTSIRPGICSDAGCRTAFNGLGMCVDHSTTNWANMSKIIDFSAGTKDGKCSKDCGCVCFKHRDCMSSKCEDHNGICLIPDLNDGTRLTFFIPNGYIKAFPCDETINCSCYVPKTLITPRTPVNSCKWNKKCSRKKGKCFRKQDKVPSQAKARGWCNKKRGCKCYKA